MEIEIGIDKVQKTQQKNWDSKHDRRAFSSYHDE